MSKRTEPLKLSNNAETSLRNLYLLTNRWREKRCPDCNTFHRRDCAFHSGLERAIVEIAPDVWREIAQHFSKLPKPD